MDLKKLQNRLLFSVLKRWFYDFLNSLLFSRFFLPFWGKWNR